jgi:hypothetical protein
MKSKREEANKMTSRTSRTGSSVMVTDVNELDETERKMWMFLMHAPSKVPVLGKTKPCKWALLVQCTDGCRLVRSLYTAENIKKKIVPVRTDYLDAHKWTCKLLGSVDISPADLRRLILQNPLNGHLYKRHKKEPKLWCQNMCRIINHEFADESYWRRQEFENFADVEIHKIIFQ